MADPAIRIRGLTKIFSPRAERIERDIREASNREAAIERHRAALALLDIDLVIERGSVQVVMGLSGSGKSTLVRHINRLIEPTSGSVLVGGTDILALRPAAMRAFRRQRISMVFQHFALLPHRSVIDNVAYGLKANGVGRRERRDRAAAWIERVGLAGTESRYPSQLSGGMQQRVGLARALATDAEILLMDEAFSALDPLIRTDMQSLLLDLQRDLKRTIVFITHDLEEGLRLGDRIAILKGGELVQEGRGQDIMLAPSNDYVAAFVGDVDRSRIVEVGTLAKPLSDASDPAAFALAAETRLRDAVRLMAEGGNEAAIVRDGAGSAIGEVRLCDLVVAMTRQTRLERDTELRLAQARAADPAGA